MKSILTIFAGLVVAAPLGASAALTWVTSPNNLEATCGNTQMHGTVIVTGGNLGSNEFIYRIGGNTEIPGGDSKSIEYAQITGAGTTGPWATATLALPDGLSGPDWAYIEHLVVSYNGYIYIVGGDTNGSDPTRDTITVLQPTASGDITAVFGTSSAPGVYNRFESSAVVNPATGILYIVGGSGPVNTVDYVQLNNDGTIGTPVNTSSLLAASYWGPLVIRNNHIYQIGALLSSSPVTSTGNVPYAVINGDGSLGTWANTTAALPEGRYDGGAVVYQGDIYSVQGTFNGNATTRDTVFKAVMTGDDITSWTTDTPTPVTGRRISAVASANGIFIVGGRQDASIINSDVYIGAVVSGANSWSVYQ
ncbi:hypothetical protein IT570_01840 [Candidatus Sumerlaeota bacterium]|nr:hypothetical protein [Candidatus Sumerlaeota bacterium]